MWGGGGKIARFLRAWGSGSSPLAAFLAGSWCTFCHSRERNQVPFHAFTIIIMAASARAPHSYLARFFWFGLNCPSLKSWVSWVFSQIMTGPKSGFNIGQNRLFLEQFLAYLGGRLMMQFLRRFVEHFFWLFSEVFLDTLDSDFFHIIDTFRHRHVTPWMASWRKGI